MEHGIGLSVSVSQCLGAKRQRGAEGRGSLEVAGS